MTLESIIEFDQQLLLWFNGSDSLFLDRMSDMLTWGFTWTPLFLALFFLVVKNNETMPQIVLVTCCAGLCILLADGMADGIVKPLVARPRPAMDPYLKYLVDVVDGHRGSGFSFFSAHAANTMSLAVFFSMLVRNRLFTVVMVLWSLLNCWTRLYLGLHYPVDIVCGLLWGIVSGLISYMVYHKFYYKISPKINYISSHYTSSGYSMADIDMVVVVVAGTLAMVTVLALTVI
ncbi:phosphatase PAP2 family protein [Hallella colorans]|uniref:phosphatase PAP2 family protein n=1 Tax=Hallella colorans TaxID=1703337 RepID=UPI0023F0820C|nr:phosphatase PAP2 family protein [Hallella colorans]